MKLEINVQQVIRRKKEWTRNGIHCRFKSQTNAASAEAEQITSLRTDKSLNPGQAVNRATRVTDRKPVRGVDHC